MRSFEVKAIGLEEMELNEAVTINGGGLIEKVVEYLAEKIVEAVAEVSVESFEDGTQGKYYSDMLEYNPYFCPLR